MARADPRTQGDCEIVLRRKPKKRYISIMQKGRDFEAVDIISRRCTELFGHVTLEKSGLRLLHSYPDVIIVRCRLSQIHPILVSIALASPPMVTLDMSSNLNRIRKRLELEKEP